MHTSLAISPAPGRRKAPIRRGAAPSFAFLGLLALLGGCGKSGVAGELAAFKDNGHAVSAFNETDAGALGAKKCQTGTIDQMAALICEYSSSDSAALGQNAAETWVGESATAVVLRRGNMLFAAADRSGADQLGKTISALGKVFRRIKK
jgi:hypothetical protein